MEPSILPKIKLEYAADTDDEGDYRKPPAGDENKHEDGGIIEAVKIGDAVKIEDMAFEYDTEDNNKSNAPGDDNDNDGFLHIPTVDNVVLQSTSWAAQIQ